MLNQAKQIGTANQHDPDIESVQFIVVDDYEFVRRIVIQGLKACGGRKITTAQDGADALHLLKHRTPSIKDSVLLEMRDMRPDTARNTPSHRCEVKPAHSHCVITDFSMKNGNGLEVLKAIRCGETSLPRETPVILLTGYSDDFVVATALELDVSAFIVKPVSRDTLRDRLHRILDTTLKPKTIGTYAAIRIPDEKGLYVGCQAQPKPACNEVRRLPIMAIQPGAVLAEDLRTERGALLLQAGTILSDFVIHRLQDVANANGLHGNIAIK